MIMFRISLCRLLLAAAGAAVFATPASAWHDRTHMAIVEAAGAPGLAYLAVGADMAKEKAPNEGRNHFSNNPKGTTVTARMVLEQTAFYNTGQPAGGCLYGAVVAALDSYRERRKDSSKYARYPLGFAMHYIGDLSMPLHNTEFDAFNKANHSANDGVVDADPQLVREIRSRMGNYPVRINRDNFRESLAVEAARLATISIARGYELEKSGRTVMDKSVAYEQLARSAALLRAVMTALDMP